MAADLKVMPPEIFWSIFCSKQVKESHDWLCFGEEMLFGFSFQRKCQVLSPPQPVVVDCFQSKTEST